MSDFVKIDTINIHDLVDIQAYLTNYKVYLEECEPENDIEETLRDETIKTIELLNFKLEYQITLLHDKGETVLC